MVRREGRGGSVGVQQQRDALSQHVDDEDKGVTNCDTPGGKQKLAIINESGLFSLTLSSQLPSAKKFKRWVTSDVLPSIRRHGEYRTQANEAQEIAVEHFVTDGHKKFITRVELQEELTKGLHQAGANKDPRKYIK